MKNDGLAGATRRRWVGGGAMSVSFDSLRTVTKGFDAVSENFSKIIEKV